MKDLHQINVKRFVQINKQVENVSKQLTGWQKKYKAIPCVLENFPSFPDYITVTVTRTL